MNQKLFGFVTQIFYSSNDFEKYKFKWFDETNRETNRYSEIKLVFVWKECLVKSVIIVKMIYNKCVKTFNLISG